MPQINMEISLGGVILIIGQIILFASFIWKRSGVEAEQRGRIDANTQKIVALEVSSAARMDKMQVEHTARTEQMDVEIDAKVSALQASINLTRDQHHELREHLANNYMKREEIHAMERRVTDGQAALRADINKIDGKLDTVLSTVLKAIADLRVQR